MCVLCSRLLFPYLVRFRSLLVHSFQVCVICEGVFKSCLLYSMLSGQLVIPGVSTLPCLPLMLSLKTIILKYFLVCVFLVSPCCVHRDSLVIIKENFTLAFIFICSFIRCFYSAASATGTQVAVRALIARLSCC